MRLDVGIGALFLVIICLLDLPIAARYNRTLGGFFLMNGKLKLPGFVASILSANLSIGNFLVFIAAWGYAFGWGGLFWFTVNLVLNVVAYVFFIPAFRSYIEDHSNSGTIHEFLAETFAGPIGEPFSRRIRLVASATTIVGLLFAVVFELHLATQVIAPLVHLNTVLVFVVLTALICIYSGIGGFHTLVFTDITQSIAMIVGTLALLPIFKSLQSLPTTISLTAAYPLSLSALNIGWPSILGICVIGSGWFLVAMDQWQRTCATRDSVRTRLGMTWYLVSIAGFGILFGLLGMFVKTALTPALSESLSGQLSNGANPLTDIFLAAQVTAVPTFLFALVAIALLAAAMSTANTFLIVSGHSFVSDLLVAVTRRSSINQLPLEVDRAFVAIARAVIIGMGVFVIAAWILLTSRGLMADPLTFFFIAYSIQFALLAPMVFARLPLRMRPAAPAVFVSLCVGFLGSLVFGFGFWAAQQKGVLSLAGIAVGDCVALTPVLTWLLGSAVLLISLPLRRSRA
jgi:Na+/proline symporter